MVDNYKVKAMKQAFEKGFPKLLTNWFRRKDFHKHKTCFKIFYLTQGDFFLLDQEKGFVVEGYVAEGDRLIGEGSFVSDSVRVVSGQAIIITLC